MKYMVVKDGVETEHEATPEMEEIIQRMKAGWKHIEDTVGVCRCGEDFEFGSYPEDGKCTVPNCPVYKHHVHCAKCGGISQIG